MTRAGDPFGGLVAALNERLASTPDRSDRALLQAAARALEEAGARLERAQNKLDRFAELAGSRRRKIAALRSDPGRNSNFQVERVVSDALLTVQRAFVDEIEAVLRDDETTSEG